MTLHLIHDNTASLDYLAAILRGPPDTSLPPEHQHWLLDLDIESVESLMTLLLKGPSDAQRASYRAM